MNKTYDMIIRNGLVALENGEQVVDIAIKDGVICEISKNITCGAEKEINADELIVMPGMVDAHVHLNDPGNDHWEGYETGSKTLAAGGVTTFFDMPLNSVPATVDAASYDAKAKVGLDNSVIDFALMGGLEPGNIATLEELCERGVVGYKAFMSSTGVDSFKEIDDWSLYLGMKEIARLGKILMLHAENIHIVNKLTKEKREAGCSSAHEYVESRPLIAELEAVNRALFFAEQTGCALHFAHISSPEAVEMIMAAKARGLDVSVETCPHYLLWNTDDIAKIGPSAKCSPPIRDEKGRLGIWDALIDGKIDMVSSDHSPAPAEWRERENGNMLAIWGGIIGGQFTLESMVDEAHIQRGVNLSRVGAWTAANPAKRFGFYPQKGVIKVGSDADFAIINPKITYEVKKEDLYAKNPQCAYIGHKFNCRVVMTINRGKIVYTLEEGINGDLRGQLLKA